MKRFLYIIAAFILVLILLSILTIIGGVYAEIFRAVA